MLYFFKGIILLFMVLSKCRGPPVDLPATTELNTEEPAVTEAPIPDKRETLSYLAQFGYTRSNPEGALANLVDEDTAFEQTIRTFQKVWKLNATGVIDNKTSELLASDRCGNTDESLYLKAQGLTKRYSVTDSWPKNFLTYNVSGYSSKLTDEEVNLALKKAFTIWSAGGIITFTPDRFNPDINIYFGSGSHGDSYPFDGKGKVLAHAFYPSHGGLHIDEDENWTFRKKTGRDIVHTVTHELGHSLGIQHSDVSESIMYPYYKFKDEIHLKQDDLDGLLELYGQFHQSPKTEQPSVWRPWCESPDLDAALYSPTDAVITLFRGNEVAKFNRAGELLQYYPASIQVLFPVIKHKIDAALHLQSVYSCRPSITSSIKYFCLIYDTFLFQGDEYYHYQGIVFQGTGAISALFPGIPSDLDTSFMAENQDIFFVKGTYIYRYKRGEGVVEGYPRPLLDEFPELDDERVYAAYTFMAMFGEVDMYVKVLFSGDRFYQAYGNDTELTSHPLIGYWLPCADTPGQLKEGRKRLGSKDKNWFMEMADMAPHVAEPETYFDSKHRPISLPSVRRIQDTKGVFVEEVEDTEYNVEETKPTVTEELTTYLSGANTLRPSTRLLLTLWILTLLKQIKV